VTQVFLLTQEHYQLPLTYTWNKSPPFGIAVRYCSGVMSGVARVVRVLSDESNHGGKLVHGAPISPHDLTRTNTRYGTRTWRDVWHCASSVVRLLSDKSDHGGLLFDSHQNQSGISCSNNLRFG